MVSTGPKSILLSVPAQLAPGYYRVKTGVTSDEAETRIVRSTVSTIRMQPIEVVKGGGKPLMAKAEVFLADDSHRENESGNVDVSEGLSSRWVFRCIRQRPQVTRGMFPHL